MQRRIMLFGAPAAGKTTLLTALAERDDGYLTVRSTETERVLRADILWRPYLMSMITLSGSFFWPQTTVFDTLLHGKYGIHGVIYVGAPVKMNIAGHWGPDAPKHMRRTEQIYWEYYTAQAATACALWTNIPWIFVFNRGDLGSEYPLLEWMPQSHRADIIHTVATTGQGLDQLQERMQRLFCRQ